MGTPEQPAGRLTWLSSLYGECGTCINHGRVLIHRRLLIAGALALPVAARAGPGRQVKALNWTGVAEVVMGERRLRIHVETRVEPFVPRARSATYLIGQEPRQVRALYLEPDGLWTTPGLNGERTRLPAAQARHEEQQYAIYGFLLMALQRGESGKGLRLTRQHCWPFDYDATEGRVSSASYTVDAPEGTGTIAETIRCADWREVDGLPWPHQLIIDQQPSTGAPSIFTLSLDSMTVEYT